MSSGFASDSFLDFSKPSAEELLSSRFLALLNGKESIPCHIIKKRNESAGVEGQFLLSPICFSGSQNIDFQAELEEGVLASCDVEGGFLQSRTVGQLEARFFSNDRWTAYIDARTNFRIPLNQTLDNLLVSMRRDSRSRVRKILKESHKYAVSWVDPEDLAVKQFSDLYSETANRLNFSLAYRFTYHQWRALLSEPQWRLYLLSQNGRVIGGSVICELEQGFDYTFTAYDSAYPEAARAIIIMLVLSLSDDHSSFLDLGGGIAEGDALASFKRSMGGVPVEFERMRFAQLASTSRGAYDPPKIFLKNRWP